MKAPWSHFARILILTLTLLVSGPTEAVILPTPPALGADTDGVSIPDQLPWPADAVPQLLGAWSFDVAANLAGFRSDPPLIISNLFLVPSPWGSALRLATDLPACLRFGIRQSNTNGDFSVRNGTASLWLRPAWTPGSASAPTLSVPLIEAGMNSATRSGWWAWTVAPGGGQVTLLGQARGQQVTYLRAPVGFVSNQWIHLALSWTPTNSFLYANGNLVTNGLGITHWPDLMERDRNGWGVGGDRLGLSRIPGELDLLFTANYPLNSGEIRGQFNAGQAARTDLATATQSALATGTSASEGTLPSTTTRPGFWLEAGLESPGGSAGGWIHGTTSGARYELFTTDALAGPWSLDQTLAGSAGQDWTAFLLPQRTKPQRFLVAAPFTDTDGDGLSDEYEALVSRTKPNATDSDGDGMPDGWEVQYGLNPLADDAMSDPDKDGFVNGLEFAQRRNPSVAEEVPLISVRASVASIAEGAGTASFTLKRSGSVAQPLEVRLELTGPSVNGYDYARIPERVVIPAGRSEVELSLTPIADGRDETDEAVILTVPRGSLYGAGVPGSAQIVIQDKDLPLVSIRASDSTAREPEFGRTDYGELEIERSGLTELPLVINLKTGPGNTATAATDVTAFPKSVTIPAGEIRARVPVIPLNNRKLTGPRLAIAEIAPSTTAYTVDSTRSTATVTIADIEPMVVTVAATDAMAEEKLLTTGAFTFTRAGGSARPLTVLYHVGGTATPGDSAYTENPADYEALSGSVTIPAGSVQATVIVKPIADSEEETLETVQVTIAGSLDYVIGDANTATVSIDDSSAPRWSSQLIQPTSVAGADGPAGLIEVTRFGTVQTDMTLPFKVSGQRILSAPTQVISFDDPKHKTLSASYALSVTGGRLGTTAGTLLMPKGVTLMTVGLKATLPSAEVKGATLILGTGTTHQETQPVFFLDRWHLITLQPTATSVVEGGQVALKVTAAATDPAGGAATVVRFNLRGTADALADITLIGASATGTDDTGLPFVDVTIPARPPAGSTIRSATLTLKAVADARVEAVPELVVARYRADQTSSVLSAAQQNHPYAPVQIRDNTATSLPPLDCDGDGFPDAFEADHDMDALTPNVSILDEDHDGVLDRDELRDGTRYDATDTDGDGVSDFIERSLGCNPLVADAALAANIRNYVPIQLRTSGVLREQDGACFRCHAPGMAFGGIQQMDTMAGHPGGSVVLTRNLLVSAGAIHQVSLTPPERYKANSTQFKTYSAEILPMNPDQPSGFVVLEADAKKPLLGQNIPIAADTFTTRKAILRVLRKPLIAVDHDRDGTIRFDASDATSLERPYRFWVNNDNDVSASSKDPEELDSAVQDHSDFVIKNMRDLEDFSRIWIDFQGSQSLINTLGFQVAFEWRNVRDGNPAIQIYSAADPDGGTGYLTDTKIAEQQVQPTAAFQSRAWAKSQLIYPEFTIRAGRRFLTTPTEWLGSSDRRYLIFEAAAPGTGELVLLLLKDGKTIVESAPIHFQFLDIKEMYQRSQATPSEAFRKPYEFLNEQPPIITTDIAPLIQNYQYKSNDKEQTTVTFVHGWNMTQSEAISFSETMYKRLWHAGYQGHFSMFRWPTDSLITPEVLDREFFDSYNFSEHRALVYGDSLKKHMATIAPEQRRLIICHSMGSMVTVSALSHGMQCTTVLFFQSAAPASMFDSRPFLNSADLLAAESNAIIGLKTPDTFLEQFGYRGYIEFPYSRFINYYNTEDFALLTGNFAKNLIQANWMENQIQSKPHLPFTNLGRGYTWYSTSENGEAASSAYVGLRAARFVPMRRVYDKQEILAFIARSRTRALGAEPNTKGPFAASDFRNLFTMGLDRTRADHSGQFNNSIQNTWSIYRSIINDLK